jgi:hypothetical protein
MRTQEQIDQIKSNIENPYVIDHFIFKEEIEHLIEIYDQSHFHNDPYKGKIKKNTGPITLDLSNFLDDNVISKILSNLEREIGQFKITAAFFFKTDYPHIIHNDDTFELPNGVYKAITLPLKVYGNNIIDYPELCFFDQYYFQGPSKFFKDEKFIPTFYNQQIYDYRDVENLTSVSFNESQYQKHFTHLKRRWLEGLSLHSAIKWVPGSAIIFDSVRLHCASDFRKLGITEKLGISIFTKK